MKHKTGLWFCILFTFALGAFVAIKAPYGGFPDEQSHYVYAQYLSVHHRLPVIGFDRSKIVTPEGFQPPLYYALGAVLIGQDQQASALRLRFLSLAFALLTVYLAWKTSAMLFGEDSPAVLLATAAVATNPQMIFSFSGVTNLSATVGTAALVFLLSVRGTLDSVRLNRNAAWLGLAYGLAILSRTINAFLCVPAAISILLRIRRQGGSWRDLLLAQASFAAPAIAVAGWWYARNWIYYEDPLLWKLHATVVGATWVRNEPLTLFYMVKQVAFMHASFWVYFGKNEYHAGIMEYTIYLVFEVLAMIGFLRILRNQETRVSMQPAGLVLVCCSALLGFAEIVWLQTKLSIPQGRYVYVSLIPIAAILASGTLALVPENIRLRRPSILISLALAIFAFYLFARYYFPHIL